MDKLLSPKVFCAQPLDQLSAKAGEFALVSTARPDLKRIAVFDAFLRKKFSNRSLPVRHAAMPPRLVKGAFLHSNVSLGLRRHVCDCGRGLQGRTVAGQKWRAQFATNYRHATQNRLHQHRLPRTVRSKDRPLFAATPRPIGFVESRPLPMANCRILESKKLRLPRTLFPLVQNSHANDSDQDPARGPNRCFFRRRLDPP